MRLRSPRGLLSFSLQINVCKRLEVVYTVCTFALSLNINDMGATRINQLRISFPYYLTGSDAAEFEMTVEAVVQFSDDPEDMKEGDCAHVSRVGFGVAWLKFQDLPASMRKAIEARAISEAYDQIEKAEYI